MASHRVKGPAIQEDVSPNLIPMVDIMFLLLLFFMLSADMSQREAAELVLPQADQIKEDKENVSTDKYTKINLHHRYEGAGFACPINDKGGVCREEGHWMYAIRGQEYTKDDIKPQLQEEANASLDPAGIDPEAQRQLSNRKVLIRADVAAPFGDVQKLIELCGQVGIYKIEVAAAEPPKE